MRVQSDEAAAAAFDDLENLRRGGVQAVGGLEQDPDFALAAAGAWVALEHW